MQYDLAPLERVQEFRLLPSGSWAGNTPRKEESIMRKHRRTILPYNTDTTYVNDVTLCPFPHRLRTHQILPSAAQPAEKTFVNDLLLPVRSWRITLLLLCSASPCHPHHSDLCLCCTGHPLNDQPWLGLYEYCVLACHRQGAWHGHRLKHARNEPYFRYVACNPIWDNRTLRPSLKPCFRQTGRPGHVAPVLTGKKRRTLNSSACCAESGHARP